MATSIGQLSQDLRYASRLLRKNPGFTAVAVFTLAIGIGANTAIFSIADLVLLRPLPYPDSKRLMRIWQSEPRMGEGHLGAAPPEFAAYRDRTRAFSNLAGYQPVSFDLTREVEPEHISGYQITANLFPTLGVKPFIGRNFTPEEERPGAAGVVILSFNFWRRHYGEEPNVIGKSLRLNEQPYEIVGIAPRGFAFPSTAATPGESPVLWVPLRFTSEQLKDWASSFDTSIVARLQPEVSLLQARDDVKRLVDEFQQEHRDIYSGNIRLTATAEPWTPNFADATRVVLVMLVGAVGFVLLIACANVANLLLARAGARQREMSIRRALGASAGRLTRQVLTETGILTIAGGTVGCALAYSILRLLNALAINEVNLRAATIDIRVLLFTFALCGAVCLLCGVVPSWMLRRAGAPETLKARQSGTGRAGRRIARSFVIVEIASCVVLLIGSGLLLRSFIRTLQVPLGFDPEHTLIVRTAFNRQRYSSPDRRHVAERTIEARLASLRGVASVALTTHVPLADERQIGFVVDGRPSDEFHWADNALVSGNYFRAMRIPLQFGRAFTDADTPQSPLVAVINQTMPRQYWPGQDPIGKGLRWGGRHLTVIGVAGDVHVEALDKPVAPTIYNSVYQIESGASTSAVFLIRMSGKQDPMRLAASAQKALWSVDPGLPILGCTTLRQVVSGSLGIRRLSLALVGGFALIALSLSLIGIYGLLSYSVTLRVQEIGVRVALGATPTRIKGLIVGQGIGLALTGILLGIVGGAVMTRYLATLLFGIQTLDPVAFAFGIVLILAVAFLASYLPARRASRVDPMVALRYE